MGSNNFYPRSPCGERHDRKARRKGRKHFYPRSPCGERLKKSPPMCSIKHFYPRSPCGERLLNFHKKDRQIRFLSTLSLRRATTQFSQKGQANKISIHALLAESDFLFYTQNRHLAKFLSTLSLRRATLTHRGGVRQREISIHALLAESDPICGSTIRIENISIHALLAESDPHWKMTNPNPKIFLSTLSLRRATIGQLQRRTGR